MEGREVSRLRYREPKRERKEGVWRRAWCLRRKRVEPRGKRRR